MKNILMIGVLMLIQISTFSQKLDLIVTNNGDSIVQPNTHFSKKFPNKQKLESASQDELNYYLKKAKETKKTGAILSIAGPVSFASGLLLGKWAWSDGTEGMWIAGLFLMFAGTGATVVGLPVLITGDSRVNRINSLRNNNSNSVYIEIAPCNFQSNFIGTQQYGVKLSFNF